MLKSWRQLSSGGDLNLLDAVFELTPRMTSGRQFGPESLNENELSDISGL